MNVIVPVCWTNGCACCEAALPKPALPIGTAAADAISADSGGFTIVVIAFAFELAAMEACIWRICCCSAAICAAVSIVPVPPAIGVAGAAAGIACAAAIGVAACRMVVAGAAVAVTATTGVLGTESTASKDGTVILLEKATSTNTKNCTKIEKIRLKANKPASTLLL